MNISNTLSISVLSAFLLFPLVLCAQDRNNLSKNEIAKIDSVESATQRAEQFQKTTDKNRMAEAKLDRKQTRAKSKDAKRAEKDANNAARQSRIAVRTERKAQKSRKEATKQEKRASDARSKSDKN